ncbi:metal-dependent hydrolase [Candidatus Parcubacteria bacterium]|nr:MAG: metal-dependent hydrolase [Candidatus Parcubacteria bacterium]
MENSKIKYKLKKSQKVKRLRISIHSDASVVVSAPFSMSQKTIEKFMREKSSWIKKSIDYYENKAIRLESFELTRGKREEIKEYITTRLEEINKVYNFDYNKVFIKNHKSRWGSCSSDRNLNFNYRIISLPQRLSDYIITHELCHISEMNHSRRFWDQVSRNIPDHLERRRELKKIIF